MANVKNGKWLIVKDIPINRGKSSIKKGGMLVVVNNVVYLDNGLLPRDYQEDFLELIATDMKHTYVRPCNDIVGKPIIGNVDLDF